MHVTTRGGKRHYRTVTFDAQTNRVRLIEQRLLPHRFKRISTKTYVETAEAIRTMVVRGAGAIGATAAYGFAQGLRDFSGRGLRSFRIHGEKVFATLKEARPTAVDPLNALLEVRRAIADGKTVAAQQHLAWVAAEAFAERNLRECEAIGRHGLNLIQPNARILTHCNAGWLAFVDFGSATAPLYTAHREGRPFHVFCDETRPRCQGANLTAWELSQEGISHEIIADNAAGYLMQRGEIDLVIVGSDRTLARTGEVTNKIGTYTKAVLASRHGIPFYVAIPFSTLDWELQSGRDIPIEERDETEVLGAWGIAQAPSPKPASSPTKQSLTYVRIANPTSRARNPAFDVTPPELITGIITPAGIFKPAELWRNRKRLTRIPADAGQPRSP